MAADLGAEVAVSEVGLFSRELYINVSGLDSL